MLDFPFAEAFQSARHIDGNESLMRIDSRLKLCHGSHRFFNWRFGVGVMHIIYALQYTAAPIEKSHHVHKSIESIPKSLKLSLQASLQYAAELFTSYFWLPLMNPNLVARKISSLFPVRLNHWPMSASPSP